MFCKTNKLEWTAVPVCQKLQRFGGVSMKAQAHESKGDPESVHQQQKQLQEAGQITKHACTPAGTYLKVRECGDARVTEVTREAVRCVNSDRHQDPSK